MFIKIRLKLTCNPDFFMSDQQNQHSTNHLTFFKHFHINIFIISVSKYKKPGKSKICQFIEFNLWFLWSLSDLLPLIT